MPAREVGAGEITKARELRDSMNDLVPSDADFEQAFAVARVSRQHLARYYLRSIDKYMKDDPEPTHVAIEDVRIVNLEHVLPLTPTEDWAVDEETAKTAQKRLGNMALMNAKKNAQIGNLTFEEKRSAYENTAFEITRMIADYDTWGLDQINDRQQKLAAEAVNTWSLKFDT